MKTINLLFILLFICLFVANALSVEITSTVSEDGIVEARAGWSPPTYGTPVVYYILQHSINDGAWYSYATTDDTTVMTYISFYDVHKVRVAGVDAEDRQGPYSLPSNTYCPADSFPNQPSIPIKE